MSTDEAAELQRLQRAAFSRNATEDDQRALARYVAEHPADRSGPDSSHPDPPGDADGSAGAAEESAGPPEVPSSARPARSTRPWRVATLLVGVACLALGWAGGWLTSAPASDPESSLIVFNQPFDSGLIADTDHSGRLDHPDTRFLGTIDGVEFFGLIGTADPNAVGLTGQLVCLEIRTDDGGTTDSCTPVATFLRKGVVIQADGEPPRTYGWGPTGQPRVLACDPNECQ